MTKYADVMAALGEFNATYINGHERLIYSVDVVNGALCMHFDFFRNGARLSYDNDMSLQTMEEMVKIRRKFADWKGA